jgi:hypothetical protein
MKNIIVYQMGKVASSTVYFTLKKYLDISEKDCVVAPPHNNIDNSRPNSDLKLYHGHKLTDFSNTFKNRIKDSENIIISLVRDPISRNISQMFESPRYGLNQRRGYPLTKDFTDSIIKKFIDDYGHTDLLNWFDVEIKNTFDINVYEHEFDSEKKFLKVVNGNNKLYVIRVEDLNDILLDFLKNELNVGANEIVFDNITSSKGHNGELFKKVKNELKVPEKIIDELYNSKFVKKFYSEDEIERFKQKWGMKENILK